MMIFQTLNGKSVNVDVKGLVYFEFEKKVYTIQPLLVRLIDFNSNNTYLSFVPNDEVLLL